MKRSRLLAIGVAVMGIAVGLLGAYQLLSRSGGTGTPVSTSAPVSATRVAPAADSKGEAPAQASFSLDDDPEGPLRLEGQVLDEHDDPVGGAAVWLSSVPPRSTKTEADGSFSFDKLVGRRYSVRARSEDRIAGPVVHQLTGSSEPVVLRLRKGATLIVEVVGEGERPIVGATVRVGEDDELKATTDEAGKVTFRGVERWSDIVVTAVGYGPARVMVTVDGERAVRVVLRRGAPVSGRVVDSAGKPVAGAKVVAADAGEPWLTVDAEHAGVTTGADGRFELGAVPAGTYRFTADHEELAPAYTAPMTVDGATAVRDVEIVMQAGATLAGRVVTADRKPAPYATVRVSPRDGTTWFTVNGDARQVTADAAGAFTLRGLSRAALRVRAESEATASAIIDVDLAATPQRRDLELVLDVTGTIAGVVVDGAGEPVGEAQVSATPDFLGGERIEDMAIGGFATATTDGDGRFALRGVRDGAYRVEAHRGQGGGQNWGVDGVTARPGDMALRIVLEAPGGIRGRVQFATGGAPAGGTVQVGWMASAAIKNGAFELTEVAPGRHDLRLRGSDFAELRKPDVVVEAGKVTDVGLLTAVRGRKVTGTIVDARGAPVGGAKVSVGKWLMSSGSETGGGIAGMDPEMLGIRTATSLPDGTFVVVGVSAEEATMIADEPRRGRSAPVVIPAGSDDPPPHTMRLRAFGSIEGVVTSGGAPLPSAMVQVTESVGMHQVMVTAGPDGKFVLDRVPAGEHSVAASQMSGMASTSAVTTAVVTAGKRTAIALDIAVGNVSLTIEIVPKAGAQVDAAQIFVAKGAVTATTGKQLTDMLKGAAADGSRMLFWFGGPAQTFDKLVPGPISICTIPITGNLRDSTFAQRLQSNVDQLDVYCVQHTVPASPAKQTFRHEVPAMKPLPAPPT